MLLSEKYNFLFVHVPKTAGSSLTGTLREISFSPYQRPIIRMFFQGEKLVQNLYNRSLLFKKIIKKYFPDYIGIHAPARRIKEVLSDEQYSKLFKFGFVRNPWDYEVSRYEDMLQSKFGTLYNEGKSMSFEDFLEWRAEQKKQNKLTLQKDWLTDLEGNLIVDFVGKFENLESDYNKVAKILGFEKSLLYLNKTKRRKSKNYRDYYNEKTKNLVRDYLKEDIEFFGYSFD